MSDTLLVITGLITPYSARGLRQTLVPIRQSGNIRRTVNGELVDLSIDLFQKYASTITCNDQRVPALDGVWPGMELTVDCVAELSYPTSGGSAGRTVVSGSSRTEGAFTFYRPRLTMLVVDYQTILDEYRVDVGWTLDLEEV
jgi:hypothetical protein